MFYNQQTDSDKQYLEDQLEQYKEAECQRNKEAGEKRAQQKKDRQQYLYAEYRTAETWPEALQKQASLMAREANYEAGENFRSGTYFTDSVKACERALEIWREVEDAKQAKIKKLQRQLEAAQDEIRFEVARQLASESDKVGWQGVASSIEEDALHDTIIGYLEKQSPRVSSVAKHLKMKVSAVSLLLFGNGKVGKSIKGQPALM